MMNTNFKRLLMAAVFSASAAVMPAQSSTQGAIARNGGGHDERGDPRSVGDDSQ